MSSTHNSTDWREFTDRDTRQDAIAADLAASDLAASDRAAGALGEPGF